MGAPKGMTFPHCHQLYQGPIKYRLCAILVLTYLKARCMGSVQRGHGQTRGENRLNMTRQGEYSNTKDDLDEQNLAGAGYEKKKKKERKKKIHIKKAPFQMTV